MKKLPIEYFDKETGSKKTENIYLTDNEYYSWNKNKKNIDKLEKLREDLSIHRNQKGKLWREALYNEAEKILKENPLLSKTQCLKMAFKNLPTNQKDKKDFDLHFKSILDTFYKKTNFQPKYKKKKS